MPKSSHNKKMKARAVVGRGEKSLLSNPGAEFRVEKEKGKEESERL